MSADLAVDLGTVEERFVAYLSAFNAGDLPAVSSALAEDVAVFVAPSASPAATGRATILPSYEQDFAAGKRVRVVRGPAVRHAAGRHGAAAVVDVGLRASLPASTEPGGEAPPDVTLDVLYYYDAGLRQVRHEISNVVTEAAPCGARGAVGGAAPPEQQDGGNTQS
eukprot:jgi/Tetstr1/441377/TSEL_029626.t1